MVGAATYSVVPLHSATENLQIKHKIKQKVVIGFTCKGQSCLSLCNINGNCYSTLFTLHSLFEADHEGKSCRVNKRASRKQKMDVTGQCALYGPPLATTHSSHIKKYRVRSQQDFRMGPQGRSRREVYERGQMQ